jgi:hypothetical protein
VQNRARKSFDFFPPQAHDDVKGESRSCGVRDFWKAMRMNSLHGGVFSGRSTDQEFISNRFCEL